MLWLPIAAILELIAIGSSASPPLSGSALFVAHVTFVFIVLSGPLALLSYAKELSGDAMLWLGVASGIAAITLLAWNRNRISSLNSIAGFFWCVAGALGLYIGIIFAV